MYICINVYVHVCIENVYDRLVKSFAPSVWEMDDAKRGNYINIHIHAYNNMLHCRPVVYVVRRNYPAPRFEEEAQNFSPSRESGGRANHVSYK